MTVGGRVVAAVAVVFWAVLPGFGLTDLSTMFVEDSYYAEVAALETSWGVLTTFAVALAFGWAAFRPRDITPVLALLWLTTAALLLGALLGASPGPVMMAAALGIMSCQRAGVGDIEDLIGASVQPYSGTDYGLFLLPKHFTSLSYREGRDGNVWKIEATRNGAHQAWDIEIMTVVDIVANGKVKVKLTADGLQTQTVAFPMITNIKLTA